MTRTPSPWLSFYKVPAAVTNPSRITVDGSTGVNNHLPVTVQPHGSQVLTWKRVPFTS